MRTFILSSVLAILVFAQTKAAFEVASIRPAAPLDMAKTMAKLPVGASKEDAPAMPQTLLTDRFGLVIYRSTAEHPVLALLVGKGGPKLKDATDTPVSIDENSPLEPGEVKVDSVSGPMRMTMGKDGSATVNMGSDRSSDPGDAS
jgi:hypothetical protein